MKLRDLMQATESIAPLAWQELWDKSGLQIGDKEAEVKKVLLTLDVDRIAIDQAISGQVDLILSHHPLIFHPLDSVVSTVPEEKNIRDLIRQDIAVYSMHTNLDAAPWGVNYALAKSLGFGQSLLPERLIPLANPVEISGETQSFLSEQDLQDQTPGFVHLVQETMQAEALLSLLRAKAGVSIQTNLYQDQPVHLLAVSGGSWAEEWLEPAVARGVDAIITGEMKYHAQIACRERGIAVYCLGHDSSELPVLAYLQTYLERVLESSDVTFILDKRISEVNE